MSHLRPQAPQLTPIPQQLATPPPSASPSVLSVSPQAPKDVWAVGVAQVGAYQSAVSAWSLDQPQERRQQVADAVGRVAEATAREQGSGGGALPWQAMTQLRHSVWRRALEVPDLVLKRSLWHAFHDANTQDVALDQRLRKREVLASANLFHLAPSPSTYGLTLLPPFLRQYHLGQQQSLIEAQGAELHWQVLAVVRGQLVDVHDVMQFARIDDAGNLDAQATRAACETFALAYSGHAATRHSNARFLID